MSLFDARNADVATVKCAVCEDFIKGGHWSSRVKHRGWTVALCCKHCEEKFQADPDAYVRRIETLERIRLACFD